MNAVDLFHATALMYAAQQEQGEQCVRLLLGENYTVGKVLADFVAYVTNDTITIALCDVKFRQMHVRRKWSKFHHICTAAQSNVIS